MKKTNHFPFSTWHDKPCYGCGVIWQYYISDSYRNVTVKFFKWDNGTPLMLLMCMKCGFNTSVLCKGATKPDASDELDELTTALKD